MIYFESRCVVRQPGSCKGGATHTRVARGGRVRVTGKRRDESGAATPRRCGERHGGRQAPLRDRPCPIAIYREDSRRLILNRSSISMNFGSRVGFVLKPNRCVAHRQSEAPNRGMLHSASFPRDSARSCSRSSLARTGSAVQVSAASRRKSMCQWKRLRRLRWRSSLFSRAVRAEPA